MMKLSKLTAFFLLVAIGLSFLGCADLSPSNTSDLMGGIIPSAQAVGCADAAELRSSVEKGADFALRLFQNSLTEGENTLVSPPSVMCALAMTANGATGDTLREMESVLGLSSGELNALFKTTLNRLNKEEEGLRFHLANSIWFTDDERFTVNRDFLQTNADFYGAGVYRAPFNDSTLKDINNALAFDGEWAVPYEEYQVSPGVFTLEDGTKKTVDFMRSQEDVYLEDGDAAVGFLKTYKGGKYAFAALLPKEGTTVSDYAASLDGDRLIRILDSARYTAVETALPKFETSFDTELSAVLKTMGMPTAFDGRTADFTGLGTSTAGNIFISRVLHKTFISVSEQGTKAGAATAVEMVDECAMEYVEPKRVILDRPFVYMLVDCETNLPFFIGCLMDAAE